MTEKPPPTDPTRRFFIRQLAGDVVTSMGSMLGAASLLQAQTAEAARELLSDPAVSGSGVPGAGGVAGAGAGAGLPTVAPTPLLPGEISAATVGYRAPFRWDADVIHLVDQRRLPDVLAYIRVHSAADAVTAINDGALVGSQAQAQVAAATLALLASKSASSRGFARRATIRGAANAFRLARPGCAAMELALDRMTALLEELGVDADPAVTIAALKAEAEAIIEEATDDHGMVVTHGIELLPGAHEDEAHVMVLGSTGAMGGGVFGGALSVVMTAHHQDRRIHALVPEGRPGLEGSRVAAWELAQAGVPYAVLADAAAPTCINAGEVEAVLAGADRITANGDVVTSAGAYGVALAAREAGVPFLVFTPSTAIDLSVAEGEDAPLEEGRATAVLRAGGQRVAPEGSKARNPQQDLVPASLVTAIVTETGVLRAPFAEGLARHIATASVRRAEARGFAALLAKREAAARPAGDGVAEVDAAAEGGGEAEGGAKAPARTPVDVSRPKGYVPAIPQPFPAPAPAAAAEPPVQPVAEPEPVQPVAEPEPTEPPAQPGEQP